MHLTFNTAGPCVPDLHYMVPPLERLQEVFPLVDERGYFVIHAPRQSGKTTATRALAQELTTAGRYAALAFSCQTAGAAGDDFDLAQQRILEQIRRQAEADLPPKLHPPAWPEQSPDLLFAALTEWARACPLPLVLIFDEIDSLIGRSLITVLSQLRTGFHNRPNRFPSSVVLCGMRDVRDYRAAAGSPNPDRLGTASPFNVLIKSLRIGDFTSEDVAQLYGQHTQETGQVFTDEGIEYAFELTQGQPWLVNALAREVVVEMAVPPTESIGPRRLEAAKERLIKARVTHLDSLAARLEEPRVQRILEPLITGVRRADPETGFDEDLSYVRDLGLIAMSAPTRIANPIYAEVIPRVLGARTEAEIAADPRSFVQPDGTLDFDRLLQEFAQFWVENGEVLTASGTYHEAAPHLVLQAFLHRLVNGGGFVGREYGVGRGRMDLLIRWPHEVAGKRVFQREALELKVWADKQADPLDTGLDQLDGYLDRLGLDTGVLVIFDRRGCARPLPERVAFEQAKSPSGRPITVLRG